MDKYIKNVSGGNKTYQGQTIADDEYFLIPKSVESVWSEDPALLGDIVNALALVCNDNQASGELPDINHGLNYLKTFGVAKTETLQEIPTGGAGNEFFGFNFTATKNTTTTFDKKVEVNFHLHNGTVECDKNVFKDEISFSIVDVDGVTYPAGTVMKKYVHDINIPADGKYFFDTNKKTELNLKNYYMRVDYKSVGTVDDVVCLVNMRGFDS